MSGTQPDTGTGPHRRKLEARPTAPARETPTMDTHQILTQVAAYHGDDPAYLRGVTVRAALNSLGPECVVLWGLYTAADLATTL